MTSSPRARRLAKRIGEIVATAIDREIKDPRLHYVTITDVRLTGDLHDATVYYTVRGETLDERPNVRPLQQHWIGQKGSCARLSVKERGYVLPLPLVLRQILYPMQHYIWRSFLRELVQQMPQRRKLVKVHPRQEMRIPIG